jgi:hypothetical protein
MKKVLLILVALALVPAMASASTITVKFVAEHNPLTVYRTILDSDGTAVITTTAGLMEFETSAGAKIYTFCIEPREFTDYNLLPYDIQPLATGPTNVPGGMGAAKAALLFELYGRFAPGLWSPAMAAVNQQALQIATWEIVRETTPGTQGGLTLDIFSGNIYFQNTTDAALGVAQGWLGQLDGTGPMQYRNAALRVGAQDFSIPVPDAGSSLLLMGMGLAGLRAWKRRN